MSVFEINSKAVKKIYERYKKEEIKVSYWVADSAFIIKSELSQDLLKLGTKKSRKNLASKWNGTYSVKILGDETTTGISWTSYLFKIKENTADLALDSFHAPIGCDGLYKCSDLGNELLISYNGLNEECKSNYYDFRVKNERNKFFISSLRFGNNKFIEIIKSN